MEKSYKEKAFEDFMDKNYERWRDNTQDSLVRRLYEAFGAGYDANDSQLSCRILYNAAKRIGEMK